MTVPISFALTYPERAPVPVPALDLAGGLTLEFAAPDLETFPLLALARRAGERAGRPRASSTPPTRSPWTRSSTGVCPSSGSRRSSAALEAVDGGRARDLDELLEADAAHAGSPSGEWRSHEHLVAILGLGLLILIHEAGHFFVARAWA